MNSTLPLDFDGDHARSLANHFNFVHIKWKLLLPFHTVNQIVLSDYWYFHPPTDQTLKLVLTEIIKEKGNIRHWHLNSPIPCLPHLNFILKRSTDNQAVGICKLSVSSKKLQKSQVYLF